jgi:hypothetical protein
VAANLTYSIFEGTLIGLANQRIFHITAPSGGGAGSTSHAPSPAVNNPYMEGVKTRGPAESRTHVHGGAIPGKYAIEKPTYHRHLGLSARLVSPFQYPMGRDGFYIHGRGPHGSDGCIVPVDLIDFQNLMDALIKEDGGILFVQESQSGDRVV